MDRSSRHRVTVLADGDRMTLRVPSTAAALAMAAAMVGMVLLVFWLTMPAPKVTTVTPKPLQHGPFDTPIWSPEDSEPADLPAPRGLGGTLRGWKTPLTVILGVVALVFGRRLRLGGIVLDRSGNVARRGRRRLCALSEVARVSLDNRPRAFVSNELFLALADGKKVTLLVYDSADEAALMDDGARIAEFLRVPFEVAYRRRPKG